MHPIRAGHSLVLETLAAACTLGAASAQTPPGFEPTATTHLNVTFGAVPINPAGVMVPQSVVLEAPDVGFAGGNETYAIFMMDFSVETNNSTDLNTTVLHWAATGLSSLDGTSSLTSQQAQIAPYIPPHPPSGQTHTYGVILFKEPTNFAIPADFIPLINNITSTDPLSSIPFRIGFNLTRFADEARLNKPIAADFYLVSESTVTATNSTSTTAGPTATSSKSSAIQSASGATIWGVEKMVAVIGTLGYLMSY